MDREITLGDRLVGDGHPVYVVAEIGINHNGDLEHAKRLIDAAMLAGIRYQTAGLCRPRLGIANCGPASGLGSWGSSIGPKSVQDVGDI